MRPVRTLTGIVESKKDSVITIILETSRRVKINDDVLLVGDKCHVAFDRTTDAVKRVWRSRDLNSPDEPEVDESPLEPHEILDAGVSRKQDSVEAREREELSEVYKDCTDRNIGLE